jgi:hypothetical protein
VEQVFKPQPEHHEEALLAPVEQLRDVAHPLNACALTVLLHGAAIAKRESGLEVSESITNDLLYALTGDDTAANYWQYELSRGAGCTNSLGSFLALDVAETIGVLFGGGEQPLLNASAFTEQVEAFIAAPSLDEATYIANGIGWLIEDERLVGLALRALEAPAIARLRTQQIGPWHILTVALARFAAFAGESPRHRARTAIRKLMGDIADFGPADFASAQGAFVWLARSADPQTTLATYFADIRSFAGRDASADRLIRRLSQFSKARLPARLIPKELSELELTMRLNS